VPAGPEQRLVAFNSGTRVSARNLFGSMPVRVKHRATVFSERTGIDKEWLQLVHAIVARLLAWPRNVSVFVNESAVSRELRLKTPNGVGVAKRVSALLAQAGAIDPADMESFVPITASAGHVTINGAISLEPVATRRSQFISLGVHLLKNEMGNNVLYEELNKVFSKSNFGFGESDVRSATDTKKRTVEGRDSKSRRSVERWPMYYFGIHLQDSPEMSDVYSILDHPTGDLLVILDLLRAISHGFLKKYGFHPHKPRDPPRNTQSIVSKEMSQGQSVGGQTLSSKSKRSSASVRSASGRFETSTVFDAWHRVKVGKATRPIDRKELPLGAAQIAGSAVVREQLIGEGGRLLRKPFDVPEDDEAVGHQDGSTYFPRGDIGPSTVDGVSVVTESPKVTVPEELVRSQISSTNRFLERRPKPTPSPWLQDVIDSWENPVFENVPARIPRAYDESALSSGQSGNNTRSAYFRSNDVDCGMIFESSSVSLKGRISKSALFDAEVILQVDLKFILIKLSLDNVTNSSQSGPSSTLVMLDQHAADERCQLEQLMAEYFVRDASSGGLRPDTEPFDEPIVFEVQGSEASVLERYRDHFSSWGIVYSLKDIGSRSKVKAHRIRVTHLPACIFERCRSEPRILIELVRKDIAKLDEGGRLALAPDSSMDTEHSWVGHFQGCPRGILELLHSRACRSAIMFNDKLNRAECEDLLRRLSHCAFPFQCAHGRPSMVPLVDLGIGSRIGAWRGDKDNVDSKQWKRWMQA
jgi:DNA mismatch repair protein MLH3